jgi:hypothetical protein
MITSEALRNASLCIGGLVILCVFFIAIAPTTNAVQIKPLVLHSKQCLDLSKQDKNPTFALQHAVEGLAYIQISRRLASDGKIQELTQLSPSDLEEIFQQRILEITTPTEVLPK